MSAHLQSTVLGFKGDARLEACLHQDRAHIKPGDSGEHVVKIQRAVMILDLATIASTELVRKQYGPSTANAVLKYKRKRSIINFGYQTRADDIVGKMTIASLDHELANRFPFQPISPSDIFIAKDDPIFPPEAASPTSTHFKIRMMGGLSGSKVIAGDVLTFQILDTTNNLIQQYVFFGGGVGASAFDLKRIGEQIRKLGKLIPKVINVVKHGSPTVTPGPFNDFSTIKPVAVGIFAGPANWTSGGGGPFTINALTLFFIAGQPKGVLLMRVSTGFTVGIGVSSTFGFMVPDGTELPFVGP